MIKNRVIIIEWKKVSLAVTEKEDIILWYRWKNNLDISFLLWMSRVVKSLESLEEEYENLIKNEKKIRLSIIENNNQNCIWYVELKDISYFHQRAELVLVILDTDSQWKWYWTESLRLICDYWFRIQWLRKLYLQYSSNNIFWEKIYEKLGFKLVWIKKKDSYVNWEYIDKIIREIFKEDFYLINKDFLD